MVSPDPNRMQTRLGRVRGLGAGGGTHHWWAQRIGSLALVPLSVWFIASLLALPTLDFELARTWLAQPLVAVLMLLFVNLSLWHMGQGLQVVIEDYVHSMGHKFLALIVLRFVMWLAMALATFSVLQIAFTV
jgi:succinate dehydrogenase / fumarate reductase, membrane anchor subunit